MYGSCPGVLAVSAAKAYEARLRKNTIPITAKVIAVLCKYIRILLIIKRDYYT
jgi:hypothetical protein